MEEMHARQTSVRRSIQKKTKQSRSFRSPPPPNNILHVLAYTTENRPSSGPSALYTSNDTIKVYTLRVKVNRKQIDRLCLVTAGNFRQSAVSQLDRDRYRCALKASSYTTAFFVETRHINRSNITTSAGRRYSEVCTNQQPVADFHQSNAVLPKLLQLSTN